MQIKYDIFISHKKEQLSWALRLKDTLELHGYTVFVDHATSDNLVAEENWVKQLHQQCTTADHMIVLWSDKIHNGSFVHKEVSWRIDTNGRVTLLPLTEFSSGPLSLQLKEHYGDRQAYRGFIDLYSSIPDKAQRDGGADDVDFFKWNDATRRLVEETLQSTHDNTQRIIEIPIIVLAMNRQQAIELDQKQNLAVPDAVFERLMTLARSTGSFDINRYHDRPEDWEPLPSMQYNWKQASISEILVKYEAERRNYVKQNRMYLDSKEYSINRWFVPYTSQIARSWEERKATIRRLEKRPCLVFIDPISIMHLKVKSLYDTVSQGLENAFIIGMAPFVPVLHQDYRDYIHEELQIVEQLGLMPPYDRFYSFFNDSLKASVMSVDHGYELARWIQFATDNITRYVSERLNSNWKQNNNLRQGRTTPPVF